MDTKILNTNISKALFFSRNEITLFNNRSAKIWFQFKKDLEGYDPRGNDIFIEKEIGIENVWQLIGNSSIKNRIDFHDYFINSKIYPTRKREFYGVWNDFVWQNKLKRNIHFDLGLVLVLIKVLLIVNHLMPKDQVL